LEFSFNITLLPSLQVPSDGITVPAPGGLKFASKTNSFGKLDRGVIKKRSSFFIVLIYR